MVCSRSALTPRRIARAHCRRSAQPSRARARDGGRRGIGRDERGGREELATTCTVVLVVKASAMASGIFYGAGDARGSPTKHREGERGKGGNGDHDDDGAAGLSPESESERAPPGARVRSPGRS